MIATSIRYCNGEPTISNSCPNKLICNHYLDFESSKQLNSNKPIIFLSAFNCKQKDYDSFSQVKSSTNTPLVMLSNGMVIMHNGKHQSIGLKVFKVLYPTSHRPLVYDGKSFYTTDNMQTIEPCYELVDVTII